MQRTMSVLIRGAILIGVGLALLPSGRAQEPVGKVGVFNLQRIAEETKSGAAATKKDAQDKKVGTASSRAMAAVAEYAKEQGFIVVVEKAYWDKGDDKQAIVMAGKAADITQNVIQRLKAKSSSGAAPKKQETAGKAGFFDLQAIADRMKPGLSVKKKKAADIASENKPAGQEPPRGRRGGKPSLSEDERLRAEQGQLKAKEAEGAIRKEIRRLATELEKKGLKDEERRKLQADLREQRQKLAFVRNRAAKEAIKPKDPNVEDFKKQALAAIAEYAKEQGFVALFEKVYWDKGNDKKAFVVNVRAVDATQDIIKRLKTKGPLGEGAKKEGASPPVSAPG